MLVTTLRSGYGTAGFAFATRRGERVLKSLAKPAEIGIFALVALYAVRSAFRLPWVRKQGAALLRLLQVVHVPLGIIVFASAMLHGLLFLIYRWKNDFHSWSGLVALSLMTIAVIAGLFTLPRPARKRTHLVLGLVTFAIAVLHIITA